VKSRKFHYQNQPQETHSYGPHLSIMTRSKDPIRFGSQLFFSSLLLSLALLLALPGPVFSSVPISTNLTTACGTHKTCSGCILVDAGCFWNVSSASCVYFGDIDVELDGLAPFNTKRHLPIENITQWLKTRPDAALDLSQCPDLQCGLVRVSFSYLSCSSQGQFTFVYVRNRKFEFQTWRNFSSRWIYGV
jgi:hypothetical protein